MKENVIDVAKKLARFNESELNDLTSILLQKHDISVTIYRFSPILVNNNCELVLLKTGGAKLLLLKTIKDILGIGLREAKDIIDNIPSIIKSNITNGEAEDIKEQLEDCGAKLEIN